MGSQPTNKPRNILILLGIILAIHTVATFLLSLNRHYELKSSLLDGGIYLQALWTFLNLGEPLVSSPPLGELFNWMGFHFSPLVLVLAPIFFIFPNIEALLLIESISIASSAIPIFLIAKKISASDRVALIWSTLFLLNPFLVNGAIWDFHETSLALPLISWILWGVVNQRRTIVFTFSIGLLLLKEHYGVAVGATGILWWCYHKDLKTAFLLALTGIIGFLVTILLIMPHFAPSSGHLMLQSTDCCFDRYPWARAPFPEGIKILWELLTGSSVWSYLIFLFAPVAGLALRAPALLLPAAADLAVTLLSVNDMPRSLFSFHSMTILPSIYIGAIIGWSKLKERKTSFLTLAVGISTVFIYFAAPLPVPGAVNPWELTVTRFKAEEQIKLIEKLIPKEASLSTQANIGIYFSKRKEIYTFPYRKDEVDYIILNTRFPYSSIQHQPFTAPYAFLTPTQYERELEKLKESKELKFVFEQNGWIVFQRN